MVDSEQNPTSSTFDSSLDNERRQAARKSLRIRVQMALPGRPDLELRSIDISTGGMGLVGDLNLPPGTACNLSFSLPLSDGTSHMAQVSGAITFTSYSSRHVGFVLGLQFKGVTQALRTALEKYTQG